MRVPKRRVVNRARSLNVDHIGMTVAAVLIVVVIAMVAIADRGEP